MNDNSQSLSCVMIPMSGRQLLLPNVSIAEVVDYASGQQVKRLDAGDGHHFYGHALFTPDGRWLVSTENDTSSARI